MSCLMGSHGMALAATATAMAVSGTVILVALSRQQQQQQQQRHVHQCNLRPCISSARKGENRRKAKKRVRFGENMIVEFEDDCDYDDKEEEEEEEIVEIVRNAGRGRGGCREMPANRAALYSGMMQDRLRRMPCY